MARIGLGWLLCCIVAMAQGAELRPADSEIAFTTRQMGVPVEGRFTRFSAQLTLNPAQPEGGSVAIAIDAASARLGSPELDAELPREPWFHAARFPRMSFQSTAIRPAGAGRYDVTGKLTIKGQARDVALAVRLQPAGAGTSVASGSFIVKRLDFGVGSGEWTDTTLLANDVQVRFKLVFGGLAAP